MKQVIISYLTEFGDERSYVVNGDNVGNALNRFLRAFDVSYGVNLLLKTITNIKEVDIDEQV